MAEPYLEGEPPETKGWFERTLKELRNRWAQTGHDGHCRDDRWACEIFSICTVCNEHVSIACSLGNEGDLIGKLLNKHWEDEEFFLFLQVYLSLLCEFVRNLKTVADVLEISIDAPPKMVCIWGNKFAKHRLPILAQHHPLWIVADYYGNAWDSFQQKLSNCKVVDRCGSRHDLVLIDQSWLCLDPKEQLRQANDERQAAVVIPPLTVFLDKTIAYFRLFLDVCQQHPETLQRFEAENYCIGCW